MTPTPSHPFFAMACSIHGGQQGGVIVSGAGTKGRLEACQIWANTIVGVAVQKGGDPTLRGCTIRDHRRAAWSLRGGAGLFVCADSAGKATTTGCVFARNAGGDVVREDRAWAVVCGLAAVAAMHALGVMRDQKEARSSANSYV